MELLDDLDRMLERDGTPAAPELAPGPEERLERYRAFLADVPSPEPPRNLTQLGPDELAELDQKFAAYLAHLQEVQAREEAAQLFYENHVRILKAEGYLALREERMTENERNARLQADPTIQKFQRYAEDHKAFAGKADARLKAYKQLLDALRQEQLRRGMALKYNL